MVFDQAATRAAEDAAAAERALVALPSADPVRKNRDTDAQSTVPQPPPLLPPPDGLSLFEHRVAQTKLHRCCLGLQ